jgi:hypothetical protein
MTQQDKPASVSIDDIDLTKIAPVTRKEFDQIRQAAQLSRLGSRPKNPIRMRVEELKPNQGMAIPCTRPQATRLQHAVQAARRDMKLEAGALKTTYDAAKGRLLVFREK